jgi:hypothetical protein
MTPWSSAKGTGRTGESEDQRHRKGKRKKEGARRRRNREKVAGRW